MDQGAIITSTVLNRGQAARYIYCQQQYNCSATHHTISYYYNTGVYIIHSGGMDEHAYSMHMCRQQFTLQLFLLNSDTCTHTYTCTHTMLLRFAYKVSKLKQLVSPNNNMLVQRSVFTCVSPSSNPIQTFFMSTFRFNVSIVVGCN